METLAQHGYEEYVEYCQTLVEECMNAVPQWEEVKKCKDSCLLITHVIMRCVVDDLHRVMERKLSHFQEWSRNPDAFERLLHNLAHASFIEQLVLILFLVIVPMFVGASIYVYFCPRRPEDWTADSPEVPSPAAPNDNAGFPHSEKQTIIDTNHKGNGNSSKHHFLDVKEGSPVPPTSPTRSPSLPSVAPDKHSPLRRLDSVHTPMHTPEQRSPRRVLWTPERRDEDRKSYFNFNQNSSPRRRAHSEASSVTHTTPDDERTLDYSDIYTDLEADSKIGDTQDMPFVLRQCVTNPRALVGWRVMLPTVRKGTVGVVLSTVKRPFNATKFMIEMHDGSVEQFALQRSARKAGVPFTLLEKVQ